VGSTDFRAFEIELNAVSYGLASPPHAYSVARRLRPWLLWPALLLMLWATYKGLFVVPPDYRQKDAYRIIFVHVPSAVLSSMVYCVMATAAAVGLIWRMKLAHAVAAACAPCGMVFTLLALVTGSIWGRSTWGVWWSWDPRLESESFMLFLYIGYIVLHQAIDDIARADRAAAVMALLGVIVLLIVTYSVIWWNSPHRHASLSIFGWSSIDTSMLPFLWVMLAAFVLLFVGVACEGLSAEILHRERNAKWLLAKDVMILEES
jgi:heme exporter protein C